MEILFQLCDYVESPKVLVAARVFRRFLRHVCVTNFCACALVLLWYRPRGPMNRAQKGVSFYFPACRFPVFLYTNCTSVYLVWQIHFFSDLEMYYAYGFVIKAMIICSSQTVDFLKVVRLVFWSGVVGPGFRPLAFRARSLALRAQSSTCEQV